MSGSAQHWSRMDEGRTTFGLKILVVTYRVLGAWALDFMLYFVVAFYFIFKHEARRSSRQFLCRVYEFNGQPAPFFWQSYIHILNFARSASDKITVWLGRYTAANIQLHGYDAYKKCRDSGQGTVIITAHLGNPDVCRAIGGSHKKIPLNVLVHNGHAEHFNRLMAKVTGQVDTLNMIEVQDITPDISIALKNRIKAGETVVVAGDRPPIKGNKHIEMVSFLGYDAPFAQGPFILGGLLDCPVFTMFVIREHDGYHLYMDEFAPTLKVSRKDRGTHLKAYITRYVGILEKMTQRYPLQWFNFYDYWKSNNE